MIASRSSSGSAWKVFSISMVMALPLLALQRARLKLAQVWIKSRLFFGVYLVQLRRNGCRAFARRTFCVSVFAQHLSKQIGDGRAFGFGLFLDWVCQLVGNLKVSH